MNKVMIACAQQKVEIYSSEEDYKQSVFKLVEKAKERDCRLIAFPEGCGCMLVPQFLLRGGADIQSLIEDRDAVEIFFSTIKDCSKELKESYLRVFSQAANEFGTYIVAGSIYLFDEELNGLINVCYVFEPTGKAMGRQVKINLYLEDAFHCVPGKEYEIFETDFMRFGIPICYEGMFPEVGRIMAFNGAEALIDVSACPGKLIQRKCRGGIWSQVQENQVFGMHCCLVGSNDVSKVMTDDYVGESVILAPIDLSPDLSGILAKAETVDQEEVITAEWDFDALHSLWRNSDTKLRKEMNMEVFQKYLPEIYQRAKTVEQSMKG